MQKISICYVSDINFLIPTIVSATSLRKYVPKEKANVYIIPILEDPKIIETLKRLTLDINVCIIPLPSLKNLGEDGLWSGTHVPRSALGRFLLSDLLPDDVDKILYVDGDTLFVSDPSELLEFEVPPGKIAAAEDANSFYRNDSSANGRFTREYFSKLGLDQSSRYLNSGVLFTDKNTWRDISLSALDFLQKNPRLCVHHDQSALNATVGSKLISISPRWNYQSKFKHWEGRRAINPVICHFTGAKKPWMGSVSPWQDVHKEVMSIISKIPKNNLPLPVLSDNEIEQHNKIFSGTKNVLRKFVDLRLKARARSVIAYHSNCII